LGSFYYLNDSHVTTRFKNAFYSEEGTKTDVSYRKIHWQSVINSLKTQKAFVLGNGAGDKQLKLNNEYQKSGFHGAASNYNAHNQFLEVLVATGFVGVFVFLSNFIFMIYLAIKKREMILFIVQMVFIVTCITES